MITFSAGANASSAYSVHNQRRIDFEIKTQIYIGEFIELFCLIQTAGKTVQKITVPYVVFAKPVFYYFTGNRIGNELTRVDVRLCEFTYFRTAFYVGAENISRRYMNDSVLFSYPRCLSALARTGRAE